MKRLLLLRRYRVFFLALCLSCGVLLYGCKPKKTFDYLPEFSDSAASRKPLNYIFGVHPLHNPQLLFTRYGPLIDYLNHHLTSIQFRLEASRDYASFEQKLFSGHFQFALPNPYQTLTSTLHGYHIFGKLGDDQDFRGIILVRKDSTIATVADLRGKAVSYPAPTALAATMLPQWFFHIHGLDVIKDLQNHYVGSQESSIMEVYLGETAAGATWPPPWRAFCQENPDKAAQLVVKWTTMSLVNNGLVVNNDVPPAILRQVSDLLFNLRNVPEGPAILASMQVSNLEPADARLYEPVKKFLDRFTREVRPVPQWQSVP